MKSHEHKTGVTLMEILIVVAIIALLATMVISLAARIDHQGKERLTENTFALLDAALGEFCDYGYSYKGQYSDFDFPLDCNDYLFSNPPNFDLKTTLMNALGAANVLITSGTHDPAYSGSEALYFFLSKVPESRKTLGKIDASLITNEDSDGDSLEISVDGKEYSLLRIIDPWGETLRYDYYPDWADYTGPGGWAGYLEYREESKRNFPVISSAGPDGIFGNDDDITNRD